MQFLHNFEKWLIERFFERFASFTQRWIGLDCFSWAKVFGLIALLVNCVMLVVRLIVFNGELVPVLCYHLLTIFYSYKLFLPADDPYTKSIASFRRSAYRERERGAKNSEINRVRVCSVMISIGILCNSLIVLGGLSLRDGRNIISPILDILPYTFFWIAAAFCACTPEIPDKSKLRKGFEKLKSKLSEIKVPGISSPEPNPA